jgi:hypothetical protein
MAKYRTENHPVTDLWIEWSGTGGTFTMHRNHGNPVFPLMQIEVDWLDKQIAYIYDVRTYSIEGTTATQGLSGEIGNE